MGADRVAARLRELLPQAIQQEAVAVQAAQIANQLQLAHALVQDGQTALAGLGAWRRYSEAALSDSIQMPSKQHDQTGGPFRAEQLRCDDPYELDDGHPIDYVDHLGAVGAADSLTETQEADCRP